MGLWLLCQSACLASQELGVLPQSQNKAWWLIPIIQHSGKMKEHQKFRIMGQKWWLTVKIHIALTDDPGSVPSTHLN